jgi:hypothetical protein
LILKEGGKVVEARRRVGMLGAERLVADRQRALEERSRSGEVALLSKHMAEVVQDRCRIGMVRTKRLFSYRQRALLEWQRPIESDTIDRYKSWLAGLPSTTVLEQIIPKVDDSLSLPAVRARIKQQKSAAEVLKRVPIPAPNIREKVRTYVEDLTRPIVGGIGADETLVVQWPTGLHALMAFLQPDVLVERLMTEIDRIANTPCPLAQREPADRQTRKRRWIGSSALRRPSLSPPVRHARLDARHGSCWASRPQRRAARKPRERCIKRVLHAWLTNLGGRAARQSHGEY